MRTGVMALQGPPITDLDLLGSRLTRNTLGGRLFPDAVRRISSHRQRGHVIVIATSALSFQVDRLAAELGVDHLLCTRLAVMRGICTGEIDGEVLWGKRKEQAVRSFAASAGDRSRPELRLLERRRRRRPAVKRRQSGRGESRA
jgi:putative phosphoserine phosphatase/1-acylglycerol-3-phosphate O-acyltransferase